MVPPFPNSSTRGGELASVVVNSTFVIWFSEKCDRGFPSVTVAVVQLLSRVQFFATS